MRRKKIFIFFKVSIDFVHIIFVINFSPLAARYLIRKSVNEMALVKLVDVVLRKTLEAIRHVS